MNHRVTLSLCGVILFTLVQTCAAATAIDLSEHPVTILRPFLANQHAFAGTSPEGQLVETSRQQDFRQTTHIRTAQTYQGHPVIGGDAVIHVPQGIKPSLTMMASSRLPTNISMDGTIYSGIGADLKQTPAYVFSEAQAKNAATAAVDLFRANASSPFTVTNPGTSLQIYVDTQGKAHYVFYVTFFARYAKGLPAKPVYLLDAITLTPYETWNDLKTARESVPGGGIGGNGNMGKKIYDGGSSHRPALTFERDATTRMCYLRNAAITIRDARNEAVPSFRCETPDASHNNVYWNTLNDETNGGYSPNNDGLFSDQVVLEMYQSWFGIPMLVKNGKPMKVTFYVHDQTQGQNAYYDNGVMVFGEGDDESYPVVAPSVVAHEMTHGFTEQHSNLRYVNQSGGLNESFSDMADKAVEYYENGHNNWEIDPELLKEGGRILRYMDEPTKNCEGRIPGDNCSISHVKDYKTGVDVHDSSGVYNKVFYLIATKWDTHKAFQVMTQANLHYWTSNSTFLTAACGVIKAAKDYQYDVQTVRDALAVVGIEPKKC